jgi:hypothetical protein
MISEINIKAYLLDITTQGRYKGEMHILNSYTSFNINGMIRSKLKGYASRFL